MNIKMKIIKIQLESLRGILNFLLNFKKPTDKLVVFCSQQLDEVIVKYYKAAVPVNRILCNNTLGSIDTQYKRNVDILNVNCLFSIT